MISLVAYDKTTGEIVEDGAIVTSFRGEKMIFVRATRVNEMRYGGRRSGLIVIREPDGGFSLEVYDNVCNLEVRSPEMEAEQ